MRTILIALTVALATWPLPGDAASRNFGVNGFDRIRVDGPFKVRLTTGVAPFATATGSAAALDQVALDVEGRTLAIHSNRSSWGGYPGQSLGPVEIAVGTHELSTVWLNGSGSLEINKVKGLTFDLSVLGSGKVAIGQADVDQLRVAVSGSGAATLAGRAGKMTALIRGSADLNASALETKDAKIGAEGPATVTANVTNSAEIDGAGVASVTLAGNPACTSKLTGSSSVSGCKGPRSGY